MGRLISTLPESSEQKQELHRIVHGPATPLLEARRAKTALQPLARLRQKQTARTEGVTHVVVIRWERLFRNQGNESTRETRSSGSKPSISNLINKEIITEVTRPPKRFTQWSSRSIALAKGGAANTIRNILTAKDLKPHLKRTFKISNDLRFEEKSGNVIGLYPNTPERALVLCCKKKSQRQALERTQTALSLSPHAVPTDPHDYVQHATITLFAALSYLQCNIFRQTAAEHIHKEWLAFLKRLARETPSDLAPHCIIDNYATHKQPPLKNFISTCNKRHEHKLGSNIIHLHFSLTSCSRLNLVTRYFRDLSMGCIREGSVEPSREKSLTRRF